MKLDEIVYNIAGTLGIEGNLDAIEQIEKQVHYYRALLIRRTVDKNTPVAPQFIQSLPCVKTKPLPQSECEDILSNCIIYRTVDKIPTSVRLQRGSGITFLGTVGKEISYSELDFNALRYQQFNKYIKNPVGYYVSDGYVYLVNTSAEHVRIEGIFENPQAVEQVTDCTGNFITFEGDYPATLDLIQQITQSILNQEANAIKRDENAERSQQAKDS
jgi:hypothetical protein